MDIFMSILIGINHDMMPCEDDVKHVC